MKHKSKVHFSLGLLIYFDTFILFTKKDKPDFIRTKWATLAIVKSSPKKWHPLNLNEIESWEKEMEDCGRGIRMA